MKTLEQRFLDKVDKTDTCWNWTAYKTNKGYGRIQVDKKSREAYRISYELYKGQIPQGMWINHTCNNRGCVNPEHLEVVTSMQDTIHKIECNRQAKGEINKHKLTNEQVVEIRNKYSTGDYTNKKLGKLYNVNGSQISKIVNYKQWKHL